MQNYQVQISRTLVISMTDRIYLQHIFIYCKGGNPVVTSKPGLGTGLYIPETGFKQNHGAKMADAGCHFFEGTEKLLEIWFSASAKGDNSGLDLRNIQR